MDYRTQTIQQLTDEATTLENDDLIPVYQSGATKKISARNFFKNHSSNVINTLNEQRSYSTEEVNTGKKWIDGKPIYRKSGYVSSISSVPYIVNSVLTDTYVDVLIESKASMKYYSSKVVVYGYTSATDRFSLNATSSGLELATNFSLADIINGFYWTVEYTKTV